MNYTLSRSEQDYVARLVERGSPATTHRYYEAKWSSLRSHFGDVPITLIGQKEVTDFLMARRKEGCSNRTIRAELTLLSRAYARADLDRPWRLPDLRIEENPRMAPKPAIVARLWRELSGPAKTALALCTLTGMRASEAFRVTADDLDRENNTLRLRGRKTNDRHVVHVCSTLLALLPTEGRLVQAEESAVRSAMVRASERAGIKQWSGPGLGRHCFATWAVEHGGYTTEQVADALGHSRPGLVTLRYIHATATKPLLKPMAELVEKVLLEAINVES